ncbi:hypothetical protein PIB30_061605, partial [Stylosanthes scabra]|nr:hypothetical protein [Stylosanthes scabra]
MLFVSNQPSFSPINTDRTSSELDPTPNPTPTTVLPASSSSSSLLRRFLPSFDPPSASSPTTFLAAVPLLSSKLTIFLSDQHSSDILGARTNAESNSDHRPAIILLGAINFLNSNPLLLRQLCSFLRLQRTRFQKVLVPWSFELLCPSVLCCVAVDRHHLLEPTGCAL